MEELQHEFGITPIEDIQIPLKSRDELPPVLMGLQHIFITQELSEQVFQLIEQRIELKKMGRSGLSLWEIFVLGVIRLTLDANYDRLEHIANYDSIKSSIRIVERIILEGEYIGWRKSKYWKDSAKNLSRTLSKVIRGGGKKKRCLINHSIIFNYKKKQSPQRENCF